MVDETLKCPQCSTPYLIVSYNPPALRFLDRLTYFTSRVARVGAIISVSSIVIVAGTTVIAMSTVYAAYAVEQFAGRDAFMLLYGEDITKWSTWAWVELPLIPVAVSLPSRIFSYTVDDFAYIVVGLQFLHFSKQFLFECLDLPRFPLFSHTPTLRVYLVLATLTSLHVHHLAVPTAYKPNHPPAFA